MIRTGMRHLLLVLLLGLISCQAMTKTLSAPVVYSDNYINVRSAVLFTEETPFHLGDVLYLAIMLEFNQDRVQISNLDETLLADSWRNSPWIVHRGPPQLTRSIMANGLARLEAIYAFQIMACPNPEAQCPGSKAYVLDDVSLGMDLIDDNGRVVSTVDINFRPAPGYIGLPSALTMLDGKLESFNLYFPGRALGLPVSATVNTTPSLLLFILGLILISSMVVAPAARTWLRHRVTARLGILGKRWEHVLDRLQNETLDDLEFQEGVRVAITWYCNDEIGVNPVHWSESDLKTGKENLQPLRTLYMQSALGSELTVGQRKEVISQLVQFFKQT